MQYLDKQLLWSYINQIDHLSLSNDVSLKSETKCEIN